MSLLNVIPVVLAGGKSSRMGTDKRFLLYQEKSWIQHSVNLLKQFVGHEDVLVSGAVNGMNCIPDLEPGQGPLMGLFSVYQYLQSINASGHWVLLMPVDMPRLTVQTLSQLIPIGSDCVDGTEVIGFEKRELPLVLRRNQKMFEKLQGLLQESSNQRSFQNLIGASNTRIIKPAVENEFLNFNSPADLELL